MVRSGLSSPPDEVEGAFALFLPMLKRAVCKRCGWKGLRLSEGCQGMSPLGERILVRDEDVERRKWVFFFWMMTSVVPQRLRGRSLKENEENGALCQDWPNPFSQLS